MPFISIYISISFSHRALVTAMRRTVVSLCAVELTTLMPSSSSLPAEADFGVRDVLFKPTSSRLRKPSVLFRRDVSVAAPYAIHTSAEDIGCAVPTYKILAPSCDYYALRIPLLKAGFRRLPDPQLPFPCNVAWGKSAPAFHSSPERTAVYQMENPFQKFNHFPRSHMHLGCKKGMALSLKPYESRLNQSIERFTPATLFYPEQRNDIIQLLSSSSADGKKFIFKPARGSCGRGIVMTYGGAKEEPRWRRVMEDIDRLVANLENPLSLRALMSHFVVQEYIEHPLLINHRKLDLRLYVAVTSYDPLVAYLHKDGLARFAAQSYEGGSNVDHRYGHLTNYSLGRKLEKPVEEGAEPRWLDLKWSLQKFETTLNELHGAEHPTLSFRAVMESAQRVIVSTLLSAKANICSAIAKSASRSSGSNYIEVYGFDIMFDAGGKAWLIEVNTLPSLESSSTMDYDVKSNVITDLLNISLMELFDRPATSFETCGLQIPPAAKKPLSPDKSLVRTFASLNEVTLPHKDIVHDLEARLFDEERYCGGFRRIFPSKMLPVELRSAAHINASFGPGTVGVLDDVALQTTL